MSKLTQQMIVQAREALSKAYAPYSQFRVGACICTEEGELYTGVNVENSSYGLTVCAETSAISQMIMGGRQKIKQMVILAHDNKVCPPCGGCRQKIFEFSTPDTKILLCDLETVIHQFKISELLPFAFSLKASNKTSS